MEKEKYYEKRLNKNLNKKLDTRNEAQELLDLLLERKGELVSLFEIDALDLKNEASSLIPLLVEEGWEIEQICKFKKGENRVYKRFYFKLIN